MICPKPQDYLGAELNPKLLGSGQMRVAKSSL